MNSINAAALVLFGVLSGKCSGKQKDAPVTAKRQMEPTAAEKVDVPTPTPTPGGYDPVAPKHPTEPWKESMITGIRLTRQLELPSAGVRVRLPTGVTVTPTGGGLDENFAGFYFHVTLSSGKKFQFAQNDVIRALSEQKRLSVADGLAQHKKNLIENGMRTSFAVPYSSETAFVLEEQTPDGYGCNVVGCTDVDDSQICIEGSEIGGEVVTHADKSECLQLLAILRSTEPL